MAKRIVYSQKAQSDRRQILELWEQQTNSKNYSRKLFNLFRKAVQLISCHPHIGILTSVENVRSKVVRDCQIFYESGETEIYILAIWDSRQNPENAPFEKK